MDGGLIGMTMNKIALVDINDNIIGYSTKDDVHKQGILHRAFSVFITNGNKMLIQKRNINKYHSGGLWSNACCSHQRENESLEEAVHRRLEEELGFDCKCKEAFHFIYRSSFNNGLIEYELDHVFLGEYCGDVHCNLNEASEVKWIDFSELKDELLTCPESFSNWFIIAAPKVMSLLEEK